MSYNASRYNLAPYNLSRASGNYIFVQGEGYENIRGYIGVGQDIYLFVVSAEHVYTDLRPTRLILPVLPTDPEREPRERIGYLVDPIGQYWIAASGSESVSCVNDSSAVIFIGCEISETIKNKIRISAIRNIQGSISEKIGAEAEAHAEFYMYPEESRELVSAVTAVEAVDELSCTLNVTIAPGERLIMNSDTYLVLLNGENVIEVHEGDWFDSLTRQTIGFSIKTNTGQENLSARIMYTERYL